MEVQAPPNQCQFFYRNATDNFCTESISFHWLKDKRSLCQYNEISM